MKLLCELGINGKMSEFNAAVGLAQLKYIGPIFEARAAIDQLYRQLLAPIAGIALSKVARRIP